MTNTPDSEQDSQLAQQIATEIEKENKMTELPYLQSERHFHLYEDYIAKIVTNWPQLTVFPKERLSVETLSTRIRICMKSLVDNQWATKIPFDKFIQIEDDIVVSTTANPGCVTCGPYDLVRKKVPLGSQVEPSVTQLMPKVNLIDPPEDLIKAVVVLHHHRLLMEPSVIKTTKPILYLQELYDVVIQDADGTYTIL
jgi:hypothetical protein